MSTAATCYVDRHQKNTGFCKYFYFSKSGLNKSMKPFPIPSLLALKRLRKTIYITRCLHLRNQLHWDILSPKPSNLSTITNARLVDSIQKEPVQIHLILCLRFVMSIFFSYFGRFISQKVNTQLLQVSSRWGIIRLLIQRSISLQ